MNNKLPNENDSKEDNKQKDKKTVEAIEVEGFEPFGVNSPIPKDSKEIKRQLGFKR